MNESTGSSEQIDAIRGQLRDMRSRLDASEFREKEMRALNATLEARLSSATSELEEIQLKNNSLMADREDADGERDDLKLFAHHMARDLGLEPGKVTLAEIRHEAKKKTKLSCHEEISSSMIVRLRKVLDPDNAYASLVDAAKMLRGCSDPAAASAAAEELMKERTLRENAEHQVRALEGQLRGAEAETLSEDVYGELASIFGLDTEIGGRDQEFLLSAARDLMRALDGSRRLAASAAKRERSWRSDWASARTHLSSSLAVLDALFRARHDSSAYEDSIPGGVR